MRYHLHESTTSRLNLLQRAVSVPKNMLSVPNLFDIHSFITMTSDQSQTASPVPSSSPLSSLTSSRINSLPRLSANSSVSSSPVTIQDKYCANCKRRQPLQNFRSNCNPTRLLARCVKCQQKRTATDAGLQPSTRPARRQRQQSPTFHRRGINPQDTPETAAARAERTTIQRNHRTRRRGGEDPSPTPPLSEMLRQRQPVPILPSPTPPPPEMLRQRQPVPTLPSPMLARNSTACHYGEGHQSRNKC